MLKLFFLAMALAVSLGTLFSGGCAGTKTVPAEPEGAVAVAIKLLESKDHTEFVKRFVPPGELERMRQRQDIDHIDRIAKSLDGERSEKLLRELKLVKDTKPVLNDMRTQATFSTKSADGKSVVIKFQLFDGKWYLHSTG